MKFNFSKNVNKLIIVHFLILNDRSVDFVEL
jgi:hypothetical protein